MSATVLEESLVTQGGTRCVCEPPPKDRLIRLVANVAVHEDAFTSVEPWEGLAHWSDQAGDWLDEFGMSIRMYWDSELIILDCQDACREFVLVGNGTLVSERPRRTGLPALPAPAWHTTCPWTGGFEQALGRRIEDLTPADLFELLDEHTRFVRAWIGMSEWDFEGLDWKRQKAAERPVLKNGSLHRDLPSAERYAAGESSDRVEKRIEAALLHRYRDELKKRSKAGRKAAESKRRNKLRRFAA